MLIYPQIDPVALELGPVRIHWYGLMYVAGFIAGWWLARRRAAAPGSTWKPVDVDDLIFFAAIGVIVGGRLGWTLVYGFGGLLDDPWSLFRVWEGGMSFHGGLAGVMIAVSVFARRRGRNIGDVFDFTVPLGPLGLFAGRIGNFINGELWGKATDVPWAFMVDGVARHPTQLYELLLEGVVMFAVLMWYARKPRPVMAVSGLFAMMYATFRSLVELWRLPDAHIGYLDGHWITMGMVLSLPLFAVGVALWHLAHRAPAKA
jgi:phosphatidylglycerol:prolipoprotein diacylglycerol transferase